MKNVRLLPVVVFSAAALLLFKGVGLVTTGGYVLTGVTIATSAGGGGGHGGGGGGEAGADVAMPSEPTMVDTAPTIFDKTPTLGEGGAEAGGHGAPAAGGHGEAAAAPAGEHGAPAPESGHGAGTEASATNSPDAPAPGADTAALAANRPKCAVEISAEAEEGGKGGGGGHGGGDAAAADHAVECVDMTDAVAVEVGPDGKLVPMAAADGTQATEQAVLARLSERRDVLDAQSQELDMRAVLVDAAEKRLEERAAQVAAMEAQINALVEEKKAMEEAQLQSIVAMYQTMKPKDAAKIFDTLDMDVLVRVARTMSARKLAPIVAAMSAEKAQALTIELAQITPEPPVGKQASVAPAAGNPSASTELPQIVGQ